MKGIVIDIIAASAVIAITAGAVTGQTANSLRLAQLKHADAQAVEKLNMSAVPDLDRSTIRRVQVALKAKGFDPGRPDGSAGEMTKAAVQKFQDRFGIKATGTLTNQTLFALGIAGDELAPAEKEKEASRPEPKQERNKARRNAKESHKRAQRDSASRNRGRSLWCAQYNNGAQNCGFYTFEQCRAAVSGVGGSCSQ
jgi:peptidoglycan hydrolase-like protein with peptidoglycan-binding domain